MPKGKYHDWITKDGLSRIRGWARDGLQDKQIAHNIGISHDTFYAWVKRFPDFSEALKSGRAPVDIAVENAMLKAALGYDSEEVIEERAWDADREEMVVVGTRTVTKRVPPNVTAQIFWLKNRKPEQWRDRRDVAVAQLDPEAAADIAKLFDD